MLISSFMMVVRFGSFNLTLGFGSEPLRLWSGTAPLLETGRAPSGKGMPCLFLGENVVFRKMVVTELYSLISSGRLSYSRDQGGAGAGNCVELDGSGGLPSLPEEEAWGLLYEVFVFIQYHSTFLTMLLLFYSNSGFYDRPHFPFLLLGFGFTKEGKCGDGGDAAVRDGGVGKIESTVAALEVEGLYGLLWRGMSHSPRSSAPPPPKKATPLQLWPSPSCLHKSMRKLNPKLPLLQLKSQSWHQESPPQLHPKLWRRLSLPTWHSFTFNWGASRGSISARLRVAQRGHQPHMLPSVHRYAENIWGCRLACPSCARPFSIWTPSGITEKVIFLSSS